MPEVEPEDISRMKVARCLRGEVAILTHVKSISIFRTLHPFLSTSKKITAVLSKKIIHCLISKRDNLIFIFLLREKGLLSADVFCRITRRSALFIFLGSPFLYRLLSPTSSTLPRS